jgi:hypothetical protein
VHIVWRHLHDGNTRMREFVDELRAARAGNLRRFRLREFAARVPEQRCCHTRTSPVLLNERRDCTESSGRPAQKAV